MPDPLTPEQVAQIRAVAKDLSEATSCSSWPTVDFWPTVLRLCATVEAQAAVIERLRCSWHPVVTTTVNGVRHEWWGGTSADALREPMSPAEQLVVYGEVVQSEEESQ